jgi:hypothetical protein
MTTSNLSRLFLPLIDARFATAAALVVFGFGWAPYADAGQAAPAAQPVRAQAATATAIEAWRKAVSALPPGKSGCFVATYPSLTLQARDCGTKAPLRIITGSAKARPFDEHASGDVLLLTKGTITTATGSMPKMERVGIIGVIDQNGKILNETNAVSFQLNTNSNLPAKSKCGPNNTKCKGWLQFTFNIDPSLGPVTQIQEWISNYGSGCPSGFTSAAGACVDNIASGTIPGPLTATTLGGLVISGKVASNGQTSMAVFIPARNLVYVSTGTDEVGAYGNWNNAEFNIFGEDNAEEVAFQQGSLMAVNVTVNSGSNFSPVSCSNPTQNTGESTNLTLGPCGPTGAGSIAFVEGVPPVVSSISPASGPTSGGTEVQLGGVGFQPTYVIQFGGTRGVQAYCPTNYNCGVYSPTGYGQVNITAANTFADGTPGPFGQAFSTNLFNYIPVTTCGVSQSCPFYQNQPPDYTITCPAPVDFYSWSGTPLSPTQPPPGMLLGKDLYSNSGPTVSESVFVAACRPGTTNQCLSYPITYASLCHSGGGGGGGGSGGGGLTCTKCGGEKCCLNPDGGNGVICVSKSLPCPVLQ